jgi:hypothetical protein
MTRHTIYILLILGLWFFVDSVNYWLERPQQHTVTRKAARL